MIPDIIQDNEPEISVFYELDDFELENEEEIIHWIHEVLNTEKKELGYINYIFCDDKYLIDINKTYLQHDTYTDIITFDYHKKRIESDIYISVERVKENAAELNISVENELLRVIVHGALHLCGYKDKTPKEATTIRAKEDFYIQLYKEN